MFVFLSHNYIYVYSKTATSDTEDIKQIQISHHLKKGKSRVTEGSCWKGKKNFSHDTDRKSQTAGRRSSDSRQAAVQINSCSWREGKKTHTFSLKTGGF